MTQTTDKSFLYNRVNGSDHSLASRLCENASSRLQFMKMILKIGDLGHASKTLPLHLLWTHRIEEEFYRQGDEERKSGLEISPFCDRTKKNLAQSQIGFFNFLVVPMYDTFFKCFQLPESLFPCHRQLQSNFMHWKELDGSLELEAPSKDSRESKENHQLSNASESSPVHSFHPPASTPTILQKARSILSQSRGTYVSPKSHQISPAALGATLSTPPLGYKRKSISQS